MSLPPVCCKNNFNSTRGRRNRTDFQKIPAEFPFGRDSRMPAHYAGRRPARYCSELASPPASGKQNSACARIARALTVRSGDPMQRNPTSNGPFWRGLVGCVVAYALIINAVLSSVVGAEWVAQAAAGLVGEHCFTDARAAAPEPAPAGQPDDSSHCAFCILAAATAVLPTEPSWARIVPGRAITRSGAHDCDLTLRPGNPATLPRGPPPPS